MKDISTTIGMIAFAALALTISSCHDCSGPPYAPPSELFDVSAIVTLATDTIPPSGGTVVVTRPGDALDGMTIQVPSGSYSTPTTFDVRYYSISTNSYSADLVPITPLIILDNSGGKTDSLMTVTIPIRIGPDESVTAFYVDNTSRHRDTLRTLARDSVSITVASHYSKGYQQGIVVLKQPAMVKE